jgi:hypothetical protein
LISESLSGGNRRRVTTQEAEMASREQKGNKEKKKPKADKKQKVPFGGKAPFGQPQIGQKK